MKPHEKGAPTPEEFLEEMERTKILSYNHEGLGKVYNHDTVIKLLEAYAGLREESKERIFLRTESRTRNRPSRKGANGQLSLNIKDQVE